jgi:hypothetical protein
LSAFGFFSSRPLPPRPFATASLLSVQLRLCSVRNHPIYGVCLSALFVIA